VVGYGLDFKEDTATCPLIGVPILESPAAAKEQVVGEGREKKRRLKTRSHLKNN